MVPTVATSGGPFRGKRAAELANVTVDEALRHPTWRMGPKITVDSATSVTATSPAGTGTVDVVGIDPGQAEGITGFKKATERVEFHRRQSNAHAWSSAICSAASLAISFSTPSAKLFEFKPLRNPMQHELVTEPFEHKDGWVYPPTKPGLGIDIIEDVVERYRSEKVLADPAAVGALV